MSEVTDLENSVKEKNPIRQIPQKQKALKDWKNKTNKKPPAKNESNGAAFPGLGMDKIAREAVEQLRKYTTHIGGLWYVLNFFFRTGVHQLSPKTYGDGMKEFTCDTKMPGCENVCYNEFLPFSMDRLWSLEMIAIFSPTVIFILFAGHCEAEQKRKKKEADQKKKEEEKAKQIDLFESSSMRNSKKEGLLYRARNSRAVRLGGKKEKTAILAKDKGKENFIWTVAMKRAFVLHIAVRVGIEAVFFWILHSIAARNNGMDWEIPGVITANSTLYNVWQVPKRFECRHSVRASSAVPQRLSPCYQDDKVLCWVARANEKTIILRYMLVMIGLT